MKTILSSSTGIFVTKVSRVSQLVLHTCTEDLEVTLFLSYGKNKSLSHRIGGGLYIGHGWGTVINAERIGKNCLVGLNITIGSRNRKEAVLEDNVSVWAHAVMLGDITIGHDSQIGAGAVVVKSVPPCSVVVPTKSAITQKDGNKCNIAL